MDMNAPPGLHPALDKNVVFWAAPILCWCHELTAHFPSLLLYIAAFNLYNSSLRVVLPAAFVGLDVCTKSVICCIVLHCGKTEFSTPNQLLLLPRPPLWRRARCACLAVTFFSARSRECRGLSAAAS